MRRITFALVLVFGLSVTATAQQWSEYVPKKQRNGIIKKSFKGTGFGGIFAGKMASVFWLTAPLARVIVSNAIDKERLTAEEAATRFESLRSGGAYTFIIDAIELHRLIFGVYGRKGDIPEAEMFLQRADNRQLFAKAELIETNIRTGFFNVTDSGLILARFPKTTRTGEALIQDLAGNVEIQFTLSGKKVVLEYKPKGMVAGLNEL